MTKKKQSSAIEFALFAPYNETVALIGDWNQWQPLEMQRGEDGWWRVEVPLADGEYQYKFRVKSKSYFAEGQLLDVADPRSIRVSLDSNENSIIVVKNGKPVVTTYQWKHDDVPLPQNHELVICEMHIGDFTPEGTFRAAIKKLDYLKELGFNAIELMPINEFPGGYNWGYTVRILYGIENSYGTPDDFCAFVDECHARGMRVILDGVFNHSEMESPLTKIDYTYWYYRENPDPDFLQWGPKFNFEHFDENLKINPAREYIKDTILFWIDFFHIDGVRFDATYAIRHHEIMFFLKDQIVQFIKGIKPFFMVAEHVPQDPAVTGQRGPMDAGWYESLSKQLMTTMLGKEAHGHQPYNLDHLVHVLNPRNLGFDSPYNVVIYIDNHDQERIMWQLGQAGFLDEAAFRRIKLGMGILLTAPGIPLIWMGTEFGETSPRTLERQKLDWVLLKNKNGADLHNYVKGLIHLRHQTPALKSETIEITMVDQEHKIIAFKRWNNEGNIVVVVANLQDQHAGEVEIALPENGKWHEHVYNYDVEVQENRLRDTLAESEVKIYVR